MSCRRCVVALLLLLAACGSTDEEGSGDPGSPETSESGSQDPDSPIGGNTDDDTADEDGSGDSADAGDDPPADGEPDDEDAAAITGNPDLDLEELAEVAPDAAEALDAIDDVVSIGECRSETVGLEMAVVPTGWQCRVLDAPLGGMDGFTLFDPENPSGVQVTVGTQSPLGPPCEALQVCDQEESIDLGSTFDMKVVSVAGVQFVYGDHRTVDAEAVVISATALSDDDLDLVRDVLDGVVEI